MTFLSPATLHFSSVLTHSDNRQVSGFGLRLRPNPSLSLGTSDTRPALYAILTKRLKILDDIVDVRHVHTKGR